MVLDLISRVARANGQAGPLVRDGEALVPIREWLATAIAPSGARYHQRRATAGKVRAALAAKGELPADTAEAERIVEAQVSERIRDTGMTAISRARSEEHTSELQSLMRSSYAVFGLKNKNGRQARACRIGIM